MEGLKWGFPRWDRGGARPEMELPFAPPAGKHKEGVSGTVVIVVLVVQNSLCVVVGFRT